MHSVFNEYSKHIFVIFKIKFAEYNKSGWPSGLRRQTQGVPYSLIVREHSGPRLRAWVQIPLLTKLFYFV
jgi:hypothetical protein